MNFIYATYLVIVIVSVIQSLLYRQGLSASSLGSECESFFVYRGDGRISSCKL